MPNDEYNKLKERKPALKFLLGYVDNLIKNFDNLNDEQQGLIVAIQTLIDPFIDIAYELNKDGTKKESSDEQETKKEVKENKKSKAKVAKKRGKKAGRVAH